MKEHAKKWAQKLLCGVVMAAMALALIPNNAGTGTVYAAADIVKDRNNTCLGTSAIAAPAAATADSAWSGSYVYFGNGIKFRVLAPTTDQYGGTTMLLDSDRVLFTRGFDDDSNIWYDENAGVSCELRDYLNGDFLAGSFTEPERAAIAKSQAASPDLDEKIFVLDAKEASNGVYGYNASSGAVRSRIKYSGGSAAAWWLRSAGSGDPSKADYVKSDGGMDAQSVDNSTVGVAPALNIDRSSIVFSTRVKDPGADGSGAEYKLTILDEKLKIAVPDGQKVVATGKTITIPYLISGEDAANARRASVLILDGKNEDILFYEALSGVFSYSAAAAGIFTLPDNLDLSDWGTGYHVYILAEATSYDFDKTDYASERVSVPSPQTYVVTYHVDNGTWSDGTTEDITETVAEGSSPARIPTDMIASYGFEGGAWDTNPSGATITGPKTFTYTFDAIPTYTVTYEVVNGTWSDGATAPQTETVMRDESPASVPTDMIASYGFEGGAWDTNPSGATITGPKTFTYTFDAIPTFTVTYEVVNGTWSDGKTAPQTETVMRDESPASIPTDMIPSSGFKGGSWDTDPSGAAITGDTTYTYTFDEIPVYTVTEGGDGSWTKGSGEGITLTVKRSIDDGNCFSHYQKTLIDGTEVSVSAEAGSTVISISAETLEALDSGTHAVKVVFDDGEVQTALTLADAPELPPTGDDARPALWTALLLSGILCLAGVFTFGRKRVAEN